MNKVKQFINKDTGVRTAGVLIGLFIYIKFIAPQVSKKL